MGIFRTLVWLVALGLGAQTGTAASKPDKPTKGDDFMPYVQLEPFVVNGKQLAISIHARSEKDRRYAADFAEEVVKVVYEGGVTSETGKGLVIIGKKGEPHPIFVFRKFQALAREGVLDPAVAAYAPELDSMLNHWQDSAGDGQASSEDGEDVDVEFDKIVTALPLPLEGIGAKLYQLAWSEKFDDAKVDKRLRALHAGDLEGNLFARFDWVFYLPPRGALEQAIDGVISDALKEEKDLGFIARTAIKGALLVVKPIIRKAIEGMRRSILFSTVVDARTDYGHDAVSALTNAYLNEMMPGQKKQSGSQHERAVKAVRAEMQALASNPHGTGTEPVDTFANAIEKAVEGRAESMAAKFENAAAEDKADAKESE